VEGLFLFEVKNLGKKYVSEAGDKWRPKKMSIYHCLQRGLVAIKGESGSGEEHFTQSFSPHLKSQAKALFSSMEQI